MCSFFMTRTSRQPPCITSGRRKDCVKADRTGAAIAPTEADGRYARVRLWPIATFAAVAQRWSVSERSGHRQRFMSTHPSPSYLKLRVSKDRLSKSGFPMSVTVHRHTTPWLLAQDRCINRFGRRRFEQQIEVGLANPRRPLHLASNLRAAGLAQLGKFVLRLQVRPELRLVAELQPQPQRGFRRDRTVPRMISCKRCGGTRSLSASAAAVVPRACNSSRGVTPEWNLPNGIAAYTSRTPPPLAGGGREEGTRAYQARSSFSALTPALSRKRERVSTPMRRPSRIHTE